MSFPSDPSATPLTTDGPRFQGADSTELRAWLELQSDFALHPETATRALLETGDPRRALALAKRRKPEVAPCVELSLDRRLALLECCGALLLPISHDRYPERLARLPDAPPLLFVRGRMDALHRPSAALVGARAATVYGKEVAFELGRALGAAGVAVVSGLARGVDAAAHRGALEAGGVTVAVQACGPETIYPAEHRELAEAICERGALVTEFPPGAMPRRYHFPLRNRLISALSQVAVVVEARERSGSLITAEHALEQGIELMAVPGPITSPASAGPNRLLRDGAAPVLEPMDVLAALGIEENRSITSEASDESPGSLDLAGPELELWSALGERPASREELGTILERSPEQIALALVELEIEGRVTEDRDGRYRRRRTPT